MASRVFVTGMGVISALGVGKEATLTGLRKGESGIGEIKYLATEHREFPAGEVKFSNEELARMANVSSPESELRTVMLGIIAAREAMADAGLQPENMRKAAFISGTTVGGMDKTECHFNKVYETGAHTDETKELGYNDCGCSTELIADAVGKFGSATTCSTACSSAANAIILGANMIKAGLADIVVAGGTEGLTRFHLNGFNTLMILSKDRCRPFDREREGINLGEGAAYIVLESESSVKEREAAPLAELTGYANTCDAYHQTASSENGEGAFLSMSKAMSMAGLSPSDIDYINAHGTGTPNNDATELAAMTRIWGGNLPPFSSTKGYTGHTTSASGAIESVVSLLAMKHGIIPRNIGFENPITEGAAPASYTQEGASLRHIINNSFGFGGNDSTLIFSRI